MSKSEMEDIIKARCTFLICSTDLFVFSLLWRRPIIEAMTLFAIVLFSLSRSLQSCKDTTNHCNGIDVRRATMISVFVRDWRGAPRL